MKFRFLLSIKLPSLWNSPEAKREPFKCVLFPTFTFTLFPIIELRTVCLFIVVPLFTKNPAFVEECFPTSKLGLLFAAAPALPKPNPAFTLKPFEFEEYSSLRDSRARLFPIFRFRVSFALRVAPIKFALFEKRCQSPFFLLFLLLLYFVEAIVKNLNLLILFYLAVFYRSY